MPATGQPRSTRSTPMTWAAGVLLVALACLISLRPMLAHASTRGVPSDRVFQTSPAERTLASAFLPGAPAATEPRRHDTRPGPDFALTGHHDDIAPSAPRSPAIDSQRPALARLALSPTRARAPPA